MARSADLEVRQTQYDFAEITIALVSGVALAMTALFLCVAPLTGKIAGGRDFVVYWATGQQLVHHADPYNADVMMRLERAAGLPGAAGVLFMRNPPWALPIVYPLGLIGIRVASLFWSLILVACLWGSVHIVWELHGKPKKLLNFLAYSFAPVLVCFITGQTSMFALLGLVLFLRLHRKRPLLAGMALWMCTLKPHLFLAFGVVLLAWVVVNSSYKVLLGAATAMAASCAFTLWIDPTAWADYARMMRSDGIEKQFIPCPSIVLRLWVNPGAIWLQYLLPAFACTWALAYFWKRRHQWDWLKEGSLVTMISVFSAPYCWAFDHVVMIPALLHGAYSTGSRILLMLLALASLSMDIGMVLGVQLPSPVLLWTAPAWLAWYLLATASANEPRDSREEGK